MTKTAPYGTWASPITTDTVVSANTVFDDVLVDPITQTIYHIEERPEDHGRCVIVDTIAKKDVLPSPYSARTFVQEYGGAAAIVYDNIIYFSNDSGDASNPDNRIYSLNLKDGSEPKPVTPVYPLWRFADFAVHPKQTNLLVVVREDHTNDPKGDDSEHVANTLCVVDTNTSAVNPILEGADFYASPVLNPSGSKISWQEWRLPDMPWEGGIVEASDIVVDSEGIRILGPPTLVAGKKGKVSAGLPSWISDTRLVYVTDGVNKFQNPFIFDTDTKQSTPVLKTLLTQDFSEPAWTLGLYSYAILDGGKYGAFTAFKDGRNVLYVIDLTAPSDPVQIEPFNYTVAQHVRTATKNTFVFTGSEASSPGGVVLGTVSDQSGSYTAGFTVLKPSGVLPPGLDKYIPKPQPLTLTAEDKHTIYAIYYPPTNPDYSGPSGEKPPGIVGVHGGPTGLEAQSLNWVKAFFTSRGFAWIDVNYRGSSGYGREYIELLNGNWGIYDVEDSREAATVLAAKPYSYIDGTRVAIRGGSAGAYTTLASLTFAKDPKYYKTACSAYGGVADTTYLAKITEKFESKYIDTLFGSPPGPEWDTRNPIKNITNLKTGQPNLSVPLLLLHGNVDGVVPPVIARGFLKDITDQVPAGLLEFSFYPNEGHHWHQARTIKDALEREFRWYAKNLV